MQKIEHSEHGLKETLELNMLKELSTSMINFIESYIYYEFYGDEMWNYLWGVMNE